MPWGTGCVYQDWEVLNLPALTSRHHPVEWGTDQDVSPGVDLFYSVFAPITLYALLPWNPPSTVTRCCLVVLWLPSGRPPSFWCLCSSCSTQPSPSPLPHCLPLIGLLGFWSIIPCSCDPGYIDGYDTKRCNPPYPTLYSNALCARSILNGFVLIYFLTKKVDDRVYTHLFTGCPIGEYDGVWGPDVISCCPVTALQIVLMILQIQ